MTQKMKARTRITAHAGKRTDNADGTTSFQHQRTLTFEKGEIVPEAWLPFISVEHLVGYSDDPDEVTGPTPEEIRRERMAEYDAQQTVPAVIAWIDGHSLVERADAAHFAAAMENEGKRRTGVLDHVEKTLAALGDIEAAASQSGD
jgi:hypothetical protein